MYLHELHSLLSLVVITNQQNYTLYQLHWSVPCRQSKQILEARLIL